MTRNRRFAVTTAMLAALLAAGPAFGQAIAGTLRGTDGTSVNAGQMRGRVTVLLFGGQMDPQSPEELPVLQQISKKYEGRNVEVVWVSLDPDNSVTDAALVQYARTNGFTGRVLRDPNGQVLGTLSTGRRPQLPTVVVLNAEGALAAKPIGGFDRESTFADRLSRIIEPLL